MRWESTVQLRNVISSLGSWWEFTQRLRLIISRCDLLSILPQQFSIEPRATTTIASSFLLLLLLLVVEQEEQTAPPIPPRPPHADCHRSPSLSRSVHQHRHRVIIDWATRKENGRTWVDLYQSPADGSSVATGLPWSNLSESIRRRRKRMKRSAQLWIFQVK